VVIDPVSCAGSFEAGAPEGASVSNDPAGGPRRDPSP